MVRGRRDPPGHLPSTAGGGASNGEFPAATQIGVSADGAVRVLATTSTKAVPAAAHLLAGLLSDDVPVRLRLAVSQATGESSTIESLREFSETLGYFERPDTELIVRNLFDRAMLAGPRKQTDEPGLEDVGAAKRQETAATPSRDTKAMLRRVAMAAAVVITLGATSWLVMSAAQRRARECGIQRDSRMQSRVRRKLALTSPSRIRSRRRRLQRKTRLGRSERIRQRRIAPRVNLAGRERRARAQSWRVFHRLCRHSHR